jgi:proteasome lid subunit RPN8/RPN11
MKNLKIPKNLLQEIIEHSEREYPRECCGMVLGPENSPLELRRIRPCQNVQNRYHALDPVNFPRTAETAYFIDPKELLAIQKEIRE